MPKNLRVSAFFETVDGGFVSIHRLANDLTARSRLLPKELRRFDRSVDRLVYAGVHHQTPTIAAR